MLWFFLAFFLAVPAFADEPIVKITNFSSNSSPEWVEIYNQTDSIIDLGNWSLGDSNTQVVYDLPLTGCLSPHTYQTFFHNDGWLNNTGDIIYLYQGESLIDTYPYSDGKLDLSYRTTNDCTPTLVPTEIPTNTPTNTPTDTPIPSPSIAPEPTSTLPPLPTITPTATKTPTPTKTPTITPSLSPSSTPTTIPTPTSPDPTPSDSLSESEFILGTTDTITSVPIPTPSTTPSVKTSSPHLLPTVLISFGSLLLLSPLIVSLITKIRHKS